MGDVAVDGLPFALRWQPLPAEWSTEGALLAVKAGARTDLFVDPGTGAETLTAPRLLGAAEGDFVFSARVSVGFGSTFDAGVLLLWMGPRSWAKLCFELSPDGEPIVVSVVTRGVSDDCNSFVVEGNEVWLRVARLGPAFAFHASTDGHRWQLVRHFALDTEGDLLVGFLAQSPLGTECSVRFDDIELSPRRLADIRSGA